MVQAGKKTAVIGPMSNATLGLLNRYWDAACPGTLDPTHRWGHGMRPAGCIRSPLLRIAARLDPSLVTFESFVSLWRSSTRFVFTRDNRTCSAFSYAFVGRVIDCLQWCSVPRRLSCQSLLTVNEYEQHGPGVSSRCRGRPNCGCAGH